jgi:MFS family permease
MNLTNAPSGTIRSALRYPDFRWLLSALAVSQIGDWLYNLALVVLVYDRTHSALWAGVTTAARVVPVVVLGPLGGVLADRFDRRRIMIMCDLARMGLMVLLAAFTVDLKSCLVKVFGHSDFRLEEPKDRRRRVGVFVTTAKPFEIEKL